MRVLRQDRRIALACVLAGILAATWVTPAAARTLHVQGGAKPGGEGTRAKPFDSLRDIERASRRGDRIVVLAGPVKEPLDGGIRLKPRQKLIGKTPRVTPNTPVPWAPRLTNTDPQSNNGDAVRLASHTLVRGLRIAGTQRGGIYGKNVRRAEIVGNEISAHNASCAPGFHIPPFNVPTTVPGVGVPISDGLHNGWAAIMIDADRSRTRVEIARNRVHDADCGDGIDVRAWGSARVKAKVTRNRVVELRQGGDFESLLAFGLQTRDRARMVARLDRNRQAGLGNDEDIGLFGPTGADSEGVFVNPSGPSRLRALVTRNHYTHTRGRGGFSANGLEFVSMGDGSRATVVVRKSSFTGTSGDVLEQLALGTNSRLRMRLDRVSARDSTGLADSGHGDTFVIPGNNGDCLIGASGGAGNVVELRVRRSVLTGCANNGLTFGSAVANGEGPTTALRLDVRKTEITGNRGGNLRIGNLAELEQLAVRVERSDLSASQGLTSTPANLTVEDLGSTERAVIDLGGGGLGSRGGNCLADGALAAAVVGYDVSAQMNWWGSPSGPGPGRTLALAGSLDTANPLDAPPAGVC